MANCNWCPMLADYENGCIDEEEFEAYCGEKCRPSRYMSKDGPESYVQRIKGRFKVSLPKL